MSAAQQQPHSPEDPRDFSVVLGGPLYQLYLRSRLARPPLLLLKRRMIFVPLFLWLPLFVMTLVQGTAFGGVRIPFLLDIGVHAKYLVAIPLLIAAEYFVHRRIGPMIEQFVNRGIVRGEDVARFRSYQASAMRLRDSMVAEIVLIVLTYTVGYWLWRERFLLEGNSWYAREGLQLTAAGYWYAWVSAPLARFFLLRWYFRILVWTRFLWQVSHMRLNLVPTHPDRAGGIAFLAACSYGFGVLLLAQGTMLAGMIGERIYFDGAQLTDFRYEILGAIVWMLVAVLGPLCVFAAPLFRAKVEGLKEYGQLSSRYVTEFDSKWNREVPRTEEPLLGSSDIQSLADLANSYQNVRQMRIFPFGRDHILTLAFLTAAPILPLVLTMIPLDELLKRIAGALF